MYVEHFTVDDYDRCFFPETSSSRWNFLGNYFSLSKKGRVWGGPYLLFDFIFNKSLNECFKTSSCDEYWVHIWIEVTTQLVSNLIPRTIKMGLWI